MKFLRKAWKAVSTLAGGRRHSAGGVFTVPLYEGPENEQLNDMAFAMALKRAQEHESAARCLVGAIMQQHGMTTLRISNKTLRELDLRSRLEVIHSAGCITIRLLPPERSR